MSLRVDPGLARSPGISYQELLDTDTRAGAAVSCGSPRRRFLGSADIPIERYTSRAWHELEVERLWRRVWQFACREEDIPEPGDYHVYEIASMSFIVDPHRARARSRRTRTRACTAAGG